MGGIITQNSLINETRQPSSLPSSRLEKISMPSYYSPQLYQSDLDACSKNWRDILTNTAEGYKSSPWAQQHFHSCRKWFNSLIYRQLQSAPKSSLNPSVLKYFLSSMIVMININFDHSHNHHHHHHPHNPQYRIQTEMIHSLCQKLIGLGIRTEHFMQFGIALFSSLATVTGRHFSISLEKCWQRLYSFILSVCLPETESRQKPQSDHKEINLNLNNNSNELPSTLSHFQTDI